MSKQINVLPAVIATGILSFSGVLVETAMNVTFPQLIHQFNITTSTVQWVTTAYLLVISIMVPLSNYLLKVHPLRTLFIFADLMFTLGLAIDAFAPTFVILLFGRVFQGISTGIAIPLMFHIILHYSPLNKRGSMMGIATLTTAIAPAIGPTYGGLLTSSYGWHHIFLFLIPLLVLALIIGLPTIPKNSITTATKLNYLQLFGTILLFSGLLIFLNQLTSWWSLIALAIGILGLMIFVHQANHADQPLVKLTMINNKVYLIGLAGFLACHFLLLGLSFVLPNFVQVVLGKSALIAGLTMLPGALIGAVLAPISGRLLDHHGAQKPILFGLTMAVIGVTGILGLLFTRNLILLITAYFIMQIGIGFAYSNLMTFGMNSVAKEQYGDANTLYNTMQQFAGAFIITVVSTIINLFQKHNVNHSLGTAIGSEWSVVFLLSFLCLMFALTINHFRTVK